MRTLQSSQSAIKDSQLTTSDPRNGHELISFIRTTGPDRVAKAIKEVVDLAFYSEHDISPEMRVDILSVKHMAKLIKAYGKEVNHER